MVKSTAKGDLLKGNCKLKDLKTVFCFNICLSTTVTSGCSFYKLFYKQEVADITEYVSKYVNGVLQNLQNLIPY